MYESTYPEDRPTPSLLTSFPALQGASGASPVLAGTSTKKQFAVVGMTVANVERHLLPAQILTIHEPDRYYEETKYYLPYGKALARTALAAALTQMGVPFSLADD